ncbi:hypothetical protein FSP39_004033 [Pinctada imbricata]|uniref:RING-type domain-containing protein n=1 Tax=Pinctada imbricata TaxID=66713 RepID=A0AA89C8D3_PINIB|nr:hypothetical protein FSP39_004033 [Pinctada imbricata]
MASANVVDEIEDTFLSCSICFQQFTRPKALPCLHSFCEGCLRDYIVSRFESSGQFPCPLCRQTIYIPPNGVYGFPDNHFIIGLRDTVGHRDNPEQHGELLRSLSSSVHLTENQSLINSDKLHVSFTKRRTTAHLLRIIGHYGADQSGFVHISGLTYSALENEIFVVDCSLNRISIFSNVGDYRGGFFCDCSIRDVAVSPNGNILVTVSRAGSAILREYSVDGRLIASYGSFYKYENPFGITLTRRNKVVITSLQSNNVHILTERRKPSIKFGSRGSGPNHFLHPYYVSVNSRDDIIITDSGNHRIKVHKNDGSVINVFGKQGSEDGDLFYPMGVCVDPYDNIYVADANNFRVQMYSPSGRYLATPVNNTYEYGVDVKPTNVAFVGKHLAVALRGTKSSQIHLYDWDIDRATPRGSQGTSTKIKTSCCSCFTSSPTYDEI